MEIIERYITVLFYTTSFTMCNSIYNWF